MILIKDKLTMEMLNDMQQGEIFRGEIEDSPDGFYINGTEKTLKWVAMRGYVNDWCIYVEDCYRNMDWDEIKTNGNKIFRTTAEAVIDADNEVWSRYRG